MGDPFGGFSPILRNAAENFYRAKSQYEQKQVVQKAAGEVVKKIAQNPRAVQAIGATVESNLSRVGVQAGTRVAVAEGMATLEAGGAAAAEISAGAVLGWVVVVAVAIVVAYLVWTALNNWQDEHMRNIRLRQMREAAMLLEAEQRAQAGSRPQKYPFGIPPFYGKAG